MIPRPTTGLVFAVHDPFTESFKHGRASRGNGCPISVSSMAVGPSSPGKEAIS